MKVLGLHQKPPYDYVKIVGNKRSKESEELGLKPSSNYVRDAVLCLK